MQKSAEIDIVDSKSPEQINDWVKNQRMTKLRKLSMLR